MNAVALNIKHFNTSIFNTFYDIGRYDAFVITVTKTFLNFSVFYRLTAN
jgi:hypothetical protein